jgi:hypothetical protein
VQAVAVPGEPPEDEFVQEGEQRQQQDEPQEEAPEGKVEDPRMFVPDVERVQLIHPKSDDGEMPGSPGEPPATSDFDGDPQELSAVTAKAPQATPSRKCRKNPDSKVITALNSGTARVRSYRGKGKKAGSKRRASAQEETSKSARHIEDDAATAHDNGPALYLYTAEAASPSDILTKDEYEEKVKKLSAMLDRVDREVKSNRRRI